MALLRKCPYCKEQGVDSAHIYEGARCLFCSKIIEVVLFLYNSAFNYIRLIRKFLFANSYGVAELILTVVFYSGYKQITSRFFPLKTYEKNLAYK
jgi:hypothetical protein